ncbi:DUF3421 domain-containing protein [Trichonephila clavata]|uniref:DUF3421 domain-containing protein n=1 Tax=Trichonephila clavata TaxID=2740835 RepID=A0A8X6IHP0_TRICU|nr:DUF3421 domain-containing protein [Trichonephila clavata]
MADTRTRINPPCSPPDCTWVSMTSGSPKPEYVSYFGGKLHGDEVYIGRVYDDGCYLVGTAIPSKGTCIYLSKKLEMKSTDTYDILTSEWTKERLRFEHVGLDSNLIFVAGGDEDDCLYCARVVDGENTYYGWADDATNTVYIPRESSVGPNKLKAGYDVLIHQLLNRLCICPTPPHPPPF